MKRNRTVFLNGHVVSGEEITPEEFFDLEAFRQCAAQWDGRDSVLVLRNVTILGPGLHESLEYLLVNRAEVTALGIGSLRFDANEVAALGHPAA